MPTTLNQITRSNAEALIPQQISDEIIQALPTQSIALRLMRPMPRMTSKQTKIPVMTGLATAGFVTGDSGQKPTTNLTWENVFITAEELAVMVPIPEAVLADASYDIWAEARPRIVEALGKAIDKAVFFGVNKPTSWPAGLVPGAITASNYVTHSATATGADLYTEVLGEDGVLAKIEEQGISPNGFVGALSMRAKLRGALDNNGQPIFRASYSNDVNGRMTYDIEGMPIVFPDNGCWDDSASTGALLLAGDFDYARYAIRQDITFKIFDQGVITNGEGGVALSLMENDCVAMRAVIRLGWQLPKPVNPISGTTYFPFAVLRNPS
jgi:HK97 family phage major capsid protein